MAMSANLTRSVSAWVAAGLAAAVLVVAVVGVASAQQGGTGNPTVDAYAQVPPTVVTPPTTGVLGERRSSTPTPTRHVKRAAAVKHVARGTLPFTGLQLAFMALGAVALLGLGLTLRRISRPLPA